MNKLGRILLLSVSMLCVLHVGANAQSATSDSASTNPAKEHGKRLDWGEAGLRYFLEKGSLKVKADHADAIGISSRGTTPFMLIAIRGGIAFLKYGFVDLGYVKMTDSFDDQMPFDVLVERYVNDIPQGTEVKESVINISQRHIELGVSIPVPPVFRFELSHGSMNISGVRGIGRCSDCPTEDLELTGGRYLRYRFYFLALKDDSFRLYGSYLNPTSADSSLKSEISFGIQMFLYD